MFYLIIVVEWYSLAKFPFYFQVIFFLEDWDNVHEYKHNSGIKDIVAEPNGTKVILVQHSSFLKSLIRDLAETKSRRGKNFFAPPIFALS